MDRKLISHRIGSILDDISRLSNALYALDTTDIQRYPDNYETLSIDAALRAERIACRLRHLIYSSTTIRKGDYLKSAGATHGITVNCEDRVLEVTLPCLLPKRKQRQSDEFLLDPLYFVLDQYAREHPLPYYRDCVVCFAQVYDRALPDRRIRDYDNLSEKQLLDLLSSFVMADDTWRISNYTPEYRETSGVGKRPVLTPDEVLRLPIKQALVIIRGQKVLKVDKMDYSKHPEASKLRSCKASAHIPEWRRLEQEQPKPSAAQPKPQAPAPKKPVKKKPKAASTSTNTKQTAAVPTAEAPNGIITTDKDSILS